MYEPTKVCKICLKDFRDDNFFGLIRNNEILCKNCRTLFKPVFKKFKVNGCKALAIYNYDETINLLCDSDFNAYDVIYIALGVLLTQNRANVYVLNEIKSYSYDLIITLLKKFAESLKPSARGEIEITDYTLRVEVNTHFLIEVVLIRIIDGLHLHGDITHLIPIYPAITL